MKHSGGSVLVWGIAASGTGHLQGIDGILKEILLDYWM